MAIAGDLPSASYLALYIISVHVLHTNTRTSTHWKLNAVSGKVEAVPLAAGAADSSWDGPTDHLMTVLTSRIEMENGEWKLEAEPSCFENCQRISKSVETNDSVTESPPIKVAKATQPKPLLSEKKKKGFLDCGRPVDSTQYDHLRGISDRQGHAHIPEPEVAMIFRTKNGPEVDLNHLESQLKKAKKEKPKSPQVYNQIGNFWRIKGDTQRSIECFRKALSLSPNNSDVLLNLARVLFNLRFHDDAYELTRRSLDSQSPDQNSWLQHFTLGEIHKARGQLKDAAHHFRHTLDLHPGFHPAQVYLQELEVNPDGTVTYYTLFIILLLVLGVLCGILTSIDGNFDDAGETVKMQRHFNRAMAMRSIKLGINPKLIRMRKQYGC